MIVNTLSRSELKARMEQQNSPCLSIFMPTHHKAGPEIQQDQAQFKKQLREAEHLLLAHNIDRTQVKALLKPVKTLFTDKKIWQHPNDGLAI